MLRGQLVGAAVLDIRRHRPSAGYPNVRGDAASIGYCLAGQAVVPLTGVDHVLTVAGASSGQERVGVSLIVMSAAPRLFREQRRMRRRTVGGSCVSGGQHSA